MKKLLIIAVGMMLNSCFLFNKKDPTPIDTLPTFNEQPLSYPIKNGEIVESSGLVVSRSIANSIWAIEDSGNPAGLHLIDTDGNYKKFVPFYYNRDCEDIAIGAGPDTLKTYIYLADIGDNNAVYGNYSIYRFLEPTAGQNSITNFETINFTYSDGQSYDAETLLLDPKTKDLYVITKREFNVKVFKLKYPQNTQGNNVADFQGLIPYFMITGGDISADGSEILLKSYLSVYYWKIKSGETIYQALQRTRDVGVPYIEEPQGEAIGWKPDSKGFYTLSETANSATPPPLYYYFKK